MKDKEGGIITNRLQMIENMKNLKHLISVLVKIKMNAKFKK